MTKRAKRLLAGLAVLLAVAYLYAYSVHATMKQKQIAFLACSPEHIGTAFDSFLADPTYDSVRVNQDDAFRALVGFNTLLREPSWVCRISIARNGLISEVTRTTPDGR